MRRTRLEARMLPLLLAANPVNWGKPGKLTTVEALAASLYLMGRVEQCKELLSKFVGRAFWTQSRNLMHMPMKSFAELVSLQFEFFDIQVDHDEWWPIRDSLVRISDAGNSIQKETIVEEVAIRLYAPKKMALWSPLHLLATPTDLAELRVTLSEDYVNEIPPRELFEINQREMWVFITMGRFPYFLENVS